MRKLFAMGAAVAVLAAPALGRADYPLECNGSLEPSGSDCGEYSDVGLTGCCDDQGRRVWCEDGLIFCIDCAEVDPDCGWDSWSGWYDCGTAGSGDPSGQFPLMCSTCDPPCEEGFKCVDEECQVCEADCDGKSCGADGCGGSCGDCDGICADGVCMSGPGCESSWNSGCGGCPCEACVCGWDDWCCWIEWDAICVSICIESCGGCADLSNCGNDVCDSGVGENCGNCDNDCTCVEGEVCFSGGCCVPSCDGLECGLDGCGGSCGACPAELVCSGDGQCVETPTCKVAQALHCNETVSGDTQTYSNLLDDYACTNWPMGGPEIGYLFVSGDDDFIEVSVVETSWAWDLDLMITEESCAAEKCIDFADATLTMDVVAGTTYFIVVDGYGGDAGAFDLTIKCQSNCEPQCDGKNCGDDACWGTCGACADGVCVDGVCMSGPGCESSGGPGCGGCPCEACVCGMDGFCCDTAWDGFCVSECIEDCGGCADLTNCGDGVCDGGVGENCSSCAADCVCVDPEVCFGGVCCVPSCDGVECGTDGCGGDCGDCPFGEYCVDGTCGPNDGCAATEESGCGGCLCEACVCDFWPECCTWAWDELCVYVCEDFCDGCGLLENCGDGVCGEGEGENCGNCPGDCLCEGDAICNDYACCIPSCDGLMCGSDGCGGSCGSCADGVCSNGVCMSGPGCESSGSAGCGGCSCEACVCSMDSYCCSFAWDSICVGECIDDCGGCADLSNCGDDVCANDVGETCGTCPSDCGCVDGNVCFDSWCCEPDCQGKECGTDGCGGTCGSCPCANCEADATWCDSVAGLCVFLDSTGCGELMDCQSACDDYDDYCIDQCVALAPPEAIALQDAWFVCLEDAGYWDCWDWECAIDTYGECITFGVQCFEGEKSCAWVYECLAGCANGDSSCGEDCMWKGNQAGIDVFWDFWTCYALYCGDATDFDCMVETIYGVCQGEYEACSESCLPVCAGKECGPDGCDGSCGQCAPGLSCTEEGQCVCIPECDGKQCGDDGCGEECGECEKSSSCDAGQCVPVCVPDCKNRECGPDGCEASCGECEAGWYCSAEQLCEPDAPPADVVTQPDGGGAVDVPLAIDVGGTSDVKVGKDVVMSEIQLTGDGHQVDVVDGADIAPASGKKSGGCNEQGPAPSGALPLAACFLLILALLRRRSTQQ